MYIQSNEKMGYYFFFFFLLLFLPYLSGSFHGIMSKVLGCSLEVSEFKLQLHYCIHFWTNAPREIF